MRFRYLSNDSMPIYIKRKKRVENVYYFPLWRRRSKAVDQSEHSQPWASIDGKSEWSLCGRYDLPYSHLIHAHCLSISVHLKYMTSDDDWYLCKNMKLYRYNRLYERYFSGSLWQCLSRWHICVSDVRSSLVEGLAWPSIAKPWSETIVNNCQWNPWKSS